MTMKIIPIGNSAGIILPKSILAKYGLSLYDRLNVTETIEGINLEKADNNDSVLEAAFTGPFSALKYDENLWGGRGEMSAIEYENSLRQGSSNRKIDW